MQRKVVSQALLWLGALMFGVLVLAGGLVPLVRAQTQAVGQSSQRQEGAPGSTEVITYTLTLNKVGTGQVAKTPDKPGYEPNEVVTISATAETGWQFTGWSGDLVSTTSPDTITMDANKAVTATFTRRCYALTLSKVGQGADLVANPTNSDGCAAGQYHYNEVITLTAAPAVGWALGSWSGTDNDAATTQTNQVTMPASAHAVTVTYSQLCYALTTAVNPAATGSIQRSPAPNCQTDKYLSGTVVQLTAVPATGYTFTGWSGAVTGTTNPTTVTMNGPRSVTAGFALACYPLSLTHTGNGADPVASPKKSSSCANNGEYVMNQAISLTAQPDSGWQVDSWLNTNNDASTSTSNALTMPAAARTVTVNYILRPTLQFSAASYSVNEDAGTATIQVARSGSTKESVTVDYATSNGSATAGTDYTAASGTLTFAANATTASFDVPILNDNAAEGTETVNLTLSDPSSHAQLGAQSTAVLNILDDEGDPTLQFSSSTYSVDEGGSSVTVTVTLFPPYEASSGTRVYVDVATADDTAVAGADYTTTTRTPLRFDPGQTEKNISIPIAEDTLDEPDETFTVTLSNADGAQLSTAVATVTIVDNDDAPTVQFSAAQYFADEGDASKTIALTLSAASAFEITVKYDGNRPGINGTVTFAPGETAASFSVPTASYSAGEEIILTLRTPTSAALGMPSSALLTILDADRGDCHPLTLTHTGFGSDPVASPKKSAGCGNGTYVKNELISVTAVPDAGWSIFGWTGTENPNDISANGIVEMPDEPHVVAVDYRKAIFFAGIMSNYASYLGGPGEKEPNNGYEDAVTHGLLEPGKTYVGSVSVNDRADFFVFYVPADKQHIEARLFNIPANNDYDLYVIRNADKKITGFSGNPGALPETISTELALKGVYFIWIDWIDGAPANQKYTLQVNFD